MNEWLNVIISGYTRKLSRAGLNCYIAIESAFW